MPARNSSAAVTRHNGLCALVVYETWVEWAAKALSVMLELRYEHSRTHLPVEIRQAIRIPRALQFDVRIGARAKLLCGGVMPSGLLRHRLCLGWR